ncbi:hypothetical protein AALP_AA4G113300 [Arabis alpina]|uniref:Glabrous enhancer-binding protein-like DBD domain-containing protein n=1 Tax=Arabis alpina TaxID=50452 RepID=A0A087H2K8_ARAAL|nr:hypothetical protein AALP_AA4G113300 [Arabis alpina]
MALSAAFKERLDQMEFTRNQRLYLLQVEKEIQVNKSQILASKHASIQSIERKCLILDQKIAAQNLKITILKSTIEDLDSKYHCSVQQLRTLKSEVEELKELDKERDKYYKLKCSEMNEFMQNVEKFLSEKRLQVENLRERIKELSSTFKDPLSLHITPRFLIFGNQQMTTPKRLDFSSHGVDGDDNESDGDCPPLSTSRRQSLRQAALKRPASVSPVAEEPKKKKKKKKSASSSRKIWNEDDELIILKELADFRSEEGVVDWDEFYKIIKGSLSVQVTKEKVLSKIRKLKRKFLANTESIKQGKDPNFTRSTDFEAYKYSLTLWGENDSENGEDDQENANAELVNGNEAARINTDENPIDELENKTAGKELYDNEAGNSNSLQELIKENETFGKETHDNKAGTENMTFGKMSHDNEAGTSNGVAKQLQQVAADKSTENKTVVTESDDEELCAIRDAFETMMAHGLTDYQKSVELKRLMNLGAEKRKEFSDGWNKLLDWERTLKMKRLEFSAKLAEATLDG